MKEIIKKGEEKMNKKVEKQIPFAILHIIILPLLILYDILLCDLPTCDLPP